jgi:hypothetical protein
VSDSSTVWLGVIAVSTAVMALVQIGAILFLARMALQIRGLVATIQQDVRPLIARANAIAEEASKTATLATAQAQKIDKLVTDLTRRVDETTAMIQQAILTPAREGMALVAALKAGFLALRGFQGVRARPGRAEDEDALFIG